MRGPRYLALALGVIAAVATPVAAHQTSIKYVDVTVDDRGAVIQLTVAPGDVTEPLGLPSDARPAVATATTPGVAAYVAGWLAVGPDGGAPCPAAGPRARPDAGGRFVIVEWEITCDDRLRHVALDFRAFFAVDPRHEAIVTVHAPRAEGAAQVVRAGEPVLRVDAGQRAGDALGLAGWVASGAHHIWEGRDHVSFVLALLLVVGLCRRDAAWARRGLASTLRRTAAILTAFTVAHSISLIAASLGWVSLPGRLVESAIAASILYTALENIIRPDVPWRGGLTFGFGLVHGLGFASVLQETLPPEHVVGPLLGFNLGVELGQLVIVAIALPVLWWALRRFGADRYRRRAMPAASIAIAVAAICWLIERALDIALLPA